ncbi:ribonuclease Z [Scopulibacillus darangshiensis]|uniref:Ribonuclease Z n=1 Tax=Scopulibacillus darangshiensis TaxID=442528 RepID=A0A4R2PAH0_9BACL|nr:ribonuclease Z [Scopulibacillus darangshiensis]TCP30895.1 ribonuclease Z [Scopulibacillus darangshiensis]
MTNLTLTMLGTGSPKPNLERSGPAQVITIDNTPILIDCGEGTVRQLMKMEINPADINYLCFTHLHSDHVFGYEHFLLGGWSLGRRKLTIIGPKGTRRFHERVLEMFEEDIDYRLSLGIPGQGLMDVTIIELEDEGGLVDTEMPAKITTTPVIHNVKTFAFRFDIGAKAITISGDTAPVDSLVKLAKGSDILVQDAAINTSSINSQTSDDGNLKNIWKRLENEHCTPAQAGALAKEADVKKLVMTHFLPNVDAELASKEASEVFDGEVIAGSDFDVFILND